LLDKQLKQVITSTSSLIDCPGANRSNCTREGTKQAQQVKHFHHTDLVVQATREPQDPINELVPGWAGLKTKARKTVGQHLGCA
jgi:hypothetical protein